MNSTDIAIVGGGAAGLMAAIWAARTQRRANIVILDSAKKLGAKILVAGGGRCNVTHRLVNPSDYSGTSQNSIKKVLRRFEVKQTIDFFEALGVPLKQEETGKLFPVSNKSRDVLAALTSEAQALGVTIRCSHSVKTIKKISEGFTIAGEWGSFSTRYLIIATGGKSLPKTGSDGRGYGFTRKLGHGLTDRLFPALVPLLLPKEHFICQISGVSLTARLMVTQASGKVLAAYTDSVLCTHFGLSGPAVLDISRHWLEAQKQDASIQLCIQWLPIESAEALNARFHMAGSKMLKQVLKPLLPMRLVEGLCNFSNIDVNQRCDQFPKKLRKTLVDNILKMVLPVTGDRGYRYAEVTAGGIPLNEIELKSMESRVCPGLYLCGEICDVDGRIGGFNFQWAWASGFIAGQAVAKQIQSTACTGLEATENPLYIS